MKREIAIAAGLVILAILSKKAYDYMNVPFREIFEATEKENSIPAGVLVEMARRESSFRADIISGERRSPVGAVGIMQFMPATAADLGVDPTDPVASIRAAGRYLRWLKNTLGTWPKAIAAYNWGVGNVRRRGLSFAPRETINYTLAVMSGAGLEWTPPTEWVV